LDEEMKQASNSLRLAAVICVASVLIAEWRIHAAIDVSGWQLWGLRLFAWIIPSLGLVCFAVKASWHVSITGEAPDLASSPVPIEEDKCGNSHGILHRIMLGLTVGGFVLAVLAMVFGWV
jgi:hypothetical protein